MTIRAYDELYLQSAQSVLGHSVDFAVMSLDLNPDDFGNALCISPAAIQFSSGNPRYTVGMNGCEFAREVLDSAYISFSDTEDIMYLDKSPEYWAGWALAFYQWHSGLSFSEILSAVPLSGIIGMYYPFHEADVSNFTSAMDAEISRHHPDTRLREYRDRKGFTQAALAEYSGVPLRQIQLMEQRQRDINRTSAETLFKLCRALGCKMEDLLETHVENNAE